ncbi:unnamed protein product [Amoebophrya sp. A120]|nr:unnamed protein product [Amoebophrya sp. A120]|eukprot:GSA120T00011064001.1
MKTTTSSAVSVPSKNTKHRPSVPPVGFFQLSAPGDDPQFVEDLGMYGQYERRLSTQVANATKWGHIKQATTAAAKDDDTQFVEDLGIYAQYERRLSTQVANATHWKDVKVTFDDPQFVEDLSNYTKYEQRLSTQVANATKWEHIKATMAAAPDMPPKLVLKFVESDHTPDLLLTKAELPAAWQSMFNSTELAEAGVGVTPSCFGTCCSAAYQTTTTSGEDKSALFDRPWDEETTSSDVEDEDAWQFGIALKKRKHAKRPKENLAEAVTATGLSVWNSLAKACGCEEHLYGL